MCKILQSRNISSSTADYEREDGIICFAWRINEGVTSLTPYVREIQVST